MARVTVEDCVRYYPNRFEMVLLSSRRARQLIQGMPPMLDPELSGNHGDKPAVMALREMGAGYISWDKVFELEEQERRRLAAGSEEDAEGLA